MSPPGSLTVALWALNMDQRFAEPDDWLAQLDRRLDESRAAGASLLALPEYTSAAWWGWAPVGTTPEREVAWMAGAADALLAAMAGLAALHEVALLAGSMPAAVGDGTYRNRAWLLLPDGRRVGQDKLCLTPAERDPASWRLEPGDGVVRVVGWRGLRIATLVCLDIELPALAARLAHEQVDLILVPSQTARRAGFARVTTCAKARAVELMCATCVVGCIGRAGVERFPNVGGAAAYLPCERELGSSGLLIEDGPYDGADGPGPLTLVHLPLGLIRELRDGAAEVWPGAWTAAHVGVETV